MLSGYTDWGVETMLSGTQIGELRQCYQVHRLGSRNNVIRYTDWGVETMLSGTQIGELKQCYQVHRLGS